MLAQEEGRPNRPNSQPAGGESIEDLGRSQQQASAEENKEDAGESSSPARKKARKVINGKQRKGVRLHMGPIFNEGAGAGGSGVLALCLSSRRNMCVHERVMAESDREAVDAACRSLTASWVIEEARKNPGSRDTCPYFDSFQAVGESISMPRYV